MQKRQVVSESVLPFIEDKSIFRFGGTKEERLYLKKMLATLGRTKIGTKFITDIAHLIRKKNQHAVFIRLASPKWNTSGLTDDDLKISITRIDQTQMNQKQKRKTFLMQMITLMHELVHIRQFLLGQDKTEGKFSIPHQAYAYLLSEAEATLFERAFEIELAPKQAALMREMFLWKNEFKRPPNVVKSFFIKKSHPTVVAISMDVFLDGIRNNKIKPLPTALEQRLFEHYINQRFKGMGVPFKYKDFPLEKVFWCEQIDDNRYLIKGEKTLLECNGRGRPIAFYGNTASKKISASTKYNRE